jgi:hypothetical protein
MKILIPILLLACLVKSKTLIRDVSGEDLGKDLEELLDYNYDEYDTEEHDVDEHDHDAEDHDHDTDDDDYSYNDDEYEDLASTNQTDPTPPTQIEASPISLPDPKQTEQELKIENDKILQESLVGGISQVKGLQNMKKELDERLRDLTPEQFMQYTWGLDVRVGYLLLLD